MVNKNNPFRCKPSEDIQQNVEDWGKSKFKPTRFKDDSRKSFRRPPGGNKQFNRNFNDRKGSFYKKESYKFNEVARNAKPENSTPWNKYKYEMEIENKEKQAAHQANMESSEAKIAMKQREINYRKSLIEQKKQEATKWEDFGKEEKSYQNNKTYTKNEAVNSNEQKSKRKLIKNQNTPESKLKTQLKKNLSNSNIKPNRKEFISKELLDNFDSRKLSYKQNDKLRSVITKTANLASENSLKRVVDNMKKKKLKKKH